MEKKAIVFQAVVPIGERRSLMNAWFKIQPTSLNISGPFHARPQPFCVGISSTFVDSVLYTIGGRVPNHFVLSDCISWLDPRNAFPGWKTRELPSPCVDSVLGVYQKCLYVLPGVWKYGYYHMDENTYLTTRKGYIWSTEDEQVTGIIEPPPTKQWYRIRACAALDEEGLLIAMDGENDNFFLYKQDWESYNMDKRLPKFIGETCFAASNGRLYILEVRAISPAFLYIYDIKKRKLVMDKKPLEFDDDLWSMDKWDRVLRLVPVTDDELCFLWLGPVSCENENGWPPVRTLHYLKVSICSDHQVKIVDNKVFHTNITDLLDCLPCDLNLFGTKAEFAGTKPELPATTMAAKENTILFQTVVPFGGEELMTSAWFKIESPHKIVGPFHVRQPFRPFSPFRWATSSTLVGSYLYTIGGEVPCSISWLDTRSPFSGWEVGELPSPCVNPVICVYGDSLYILAAPEGYIWNTRVNECLETRILPPKVEGGERRWRSIRACVALDGQGLLIAMDGEKNNFFLYKPEENDWKICEFEDPLPKFSGKTNFAASNGRLYIFEVQVTSPAKLYIYDITEGKLVKDKMPNLKPAYDLWPFCENLDRVVCHLVPVANDKLCFLSLFQFPFFGYKHREAYLLYYLKFKFSFNRNPSNSEVGFESCIEDFAVFLIPNFIQLLGCLPGGPEQFRAEVEGKSPPDNLLTQLADPFHEQEGPKVTAEPETEPFSEFSHSKGKNIPEITAADEAMLEIRRAEILAEAKLLMSERIAAESETSKGKNIPAITAADQVMHDSRRAEILAEAKRLMDEREKLEQERERLEQARKREAYIAALLMEKF